ncbi:MAG: putative Ig domain-containing protein, partial [Pseudomonadota bacterium]
MTVLEQSGVWLDNIAAGHGGFVVTGALQTNNSGSAMSSVGDLNGDGLDDFVLSALSARVYGPGADESHVIEGQSARAYVVFGKTDTSPINVSALAAGTGGFMIYSETADEARGDAVSGVGDVNGDGLADLIIGTPYNQARGEYTGRSYVVFGKTDTAALNLERVTQGEGGFAINGESANDITGYVVSSVGDANGDGFADLLISAPGSHADGDAFSGRSYVVFGKTDGTAIDLGVLKAQGVGGFAIDGESQSFSGVSVAGVGDMNGDGLADVIVTAPLAGSVGEFSVDNPTPVFAVGRSYVVFGKTDTTTIKLDALGSGGFVINGNFSNDLTFDAVVGLGDVNGDGFADAMIRDGDSRSYVVFGKSELATVNLENVAQGEGGFLVNFDRASSDGNHGFVNQISSAGDVNGDGLADFLISLPAASNSGVPIYNQQTQPNPQLDHSGRTYLVYGQRGNTELHLSDIDAGHGGFVIETSEPYAWSGRSISAAGDVNGDGLADLLVMAVDAVNSSNAYLIFGASDGAFAQTAIDQLGGAGNDVLLGTSASETLVGGAGDDFIFAAGGADVLYGGAGNDRFVLDADNFRTLSAADAPDSLRHARIDGGSGIDTLILSNNDNSPININPQSLARLESIERIELSGSDNASLQLSVADVLALSNVRVTNQSGWQSGSYSLGSQFATQHQLVIDGAAGNTLTLTPSDSAGFPAGRWYEMGQVYYGERAYQVYNNQLSSDSNARAQLIVAAGIQVNNPDGYLNAPVLTHPLDTQNLRAGLAYSFTLPADTFSDADIPFGDRLTYRAHQANGNALPSWLHFDASTGTFSGTPSHYNVGDLTLAITATDLSGAFVSTQVSFVVASEPSVWLSAIALGRGGFVINGECAEDGSGWAVSSAGDVNGDGLDDFLIGAPQHDNDKLTPAGSTYVAGGHLIQLSGADAGRGYVVFGKTDSNAVNLSAIAAGQGGFALNGEIAYGWSGNAVSSAGDVNGDGLADLMISNGRGVTAGEEAGRTYIVFGKQDTRAIDLSAVAEGRGGFVLRKTQSAYWDENSVSAVGDVNQDGLDDFLLGGLFDYSNQGREFGHSYLVFGKTDGAQIDLNALANNATGGFVINGECSFDDTGYVVSAAGDMNHDGLADFLIGAEFYNSNGGKLGRTYVVFG